jgi:hypothetical protein
MKIMLNDSVKTRAYAPHATENNLSRDLSRALKRRAQYLINDRWLDAETRAIIRYGLEINDPALSELVRRVDAGESIVERIDVATSLASEDDSNDEKIEALVDIICRAGDEPGRGDEAGRRSAALLVLMATLERAPNPKLLMNAAKHLAFTRCGELNVYGLVDAHIALIEGELFRSFEV